MAGWRQERQRQRRRGGRLARAARGPVLRPLVGMDKEEIVAEARRIGTFEVSALPDQDCCQLFVPRHPATAAQIEDVLRAEQALDGPALEQAAVRATEEERFEFPPRSTPTAQEATA